MLRHCPPGTDGHPCLQPLLMVSGCCSKTWTMRCNAHRSDQCQPCSDRYLRALRRKVIEGLGLNTHPYRYLLTTTAPGDPGHRRWIPGKAGVHPVCGCDQGHDLATWNPLAGGCWNRLRTSLRRRDPGMAFHRFAELQKRGAIHHHSILLSNVQLDPLEVQAMVLAAGYGCVVDYRPLLGENVAAYLTKYCTKDLGKRVDAPWQVIDEQTGEISEPDPTYRRHSCSQNWGITLRQIRAANLASWNRAQTVRAVCAANDQGSAGVQGSSPAVARRAEPPSVGPP